MKFPDYNFHPRSKLFGQEILFTLKFKASTTSWTLEKFITFVVIRDGWKFETNLTTKTPKKSCKLKIHFDITSASNVSYDFCRRFFRSEAEKFLNFLIAGICIFTLSESWNLHVLVLLHRNLFQMENLEKHEKIVYTNAKKQREKCREYFELASLEFIAY